ncbi:MAG: nucleoside 2-deoxyribosyltransferase [Bacteroidota bacterium]
MKIYFAAPLFSQAEKNFNQNLTDQIETLGFDVFLPQRDGIEKNKHPYDKMSEENRRNAMFTLDRDQILDCDIFLFILDGRVPDEGACVELGMVYAQKYLKNNNKIIIGLQTDIRASFLNSKLNPMIRVALQKIHKTEGELIDNLKSIIKK